MSSRASLPQGTPFRGVIEYYSNVSKTASHNALYYSKVKPPTYQITHIYYPRSLCNFPFYIFIVPAGMKKKPKH